MRYILIPATLAGTVVYNAETKKAHTGHHYVQDGEEDVYSNNHLVRTVEVTREMPITTPLYDMDKRKVLLITDKKQLAEYNVKFLRKIQGGCQNFISEYTSKMEQLGDCRRELKLISSVNPISDSAITTVVRRLNMDS